MLLNILLSILNALFGVLGNERGSVSMGQAWHLQFDSVLHLTYQQMDALLEGQIDKRYVHTGVRASIDHFERLGNTVANDNVARHGQTRTVNPNHSKRAAFLVSSDAAVLLAHIDEVRTMVNPQSAYMQTIVASLKRRSDKHVIAGATGSANVATVASDGSISYSTQALLSTHTKTGTGTTNALALADIINANVLLSKAGVPGGPQNRLAIYSPGQEVNVLNITQASSSDFTANAYIHDKGTADGMNWEGFHWIMIADAVDEALNTITTMLPLSSTTRTIIFMAKDAVGLSIGSGIQNKISERPDLNDELQVRAFMDMGAVRIWEGGVVTYAVLEN
jgi:hypothetical protein